MTPTWLDVAIATDGFVDRTDHTQLAERILHESEEQLVDAIAAELLRARSPSLWSQRNRALVARAGAVLEVATRARARSARSRSTRLRSRSRLSRITAHLSSSR